MTDSISSLTVYLPGGELADTVEATDEDDIGLE